MFNLKISILFTQYPACLFVGRHRFQIVSSLGLMILAGIGTSQAGHSQTVSEYDELSQTNVVRLKITPAAEPNPRFRFRFTVPVDQQVPGNAANHYYRQFAEQPLSTIYGKLRQQFGDEMLNWFGTPVAELPPTEAKQAAQAFDYYIDHFVARATRCRTCDWGLAEESLTLTEWIDLPIPEIQTTREIARILSLRARVALIDRDFEKAIEQIRMGYQLSYHVRSAQLIVAQLIADANANIAHGAVLELIGLPESPNLYWALADLPSTRNRHQQVMQLEFRHILQILPELTTLEMDNKSDQQWKEEYKHVVEKMLWIFSGGDSSASGTSEFALTQSMAMGFALVGYPGAKQRLVETGLDHEFVANLPVGQALLWDMKNELERIVQMGESLAVLPLHLIVPEVEKFERELGTEHLRSLGKHFASLMTPAVAQVWNAHIRTERKRCVLMVIEAIRMHLAQTGKLPATLDEIVVVPLPPNPATNQSFSYHVDGTTAVLELPKSDGIAPAERFEIQIAN